VNNDDLAWQYNCLDTVYTRECGEVETANLKAMGLIEQDAFQQKMFWPVLEAMKRGVRVDLKRRAQFAMELFNALEEREQWFKEVLGHTLNPRSPTQMAKLFYQDFQMPVIRKRGVMGRMGSITCDDDALRRMAYSEPLLRPILRRISEFRTIGVFLSTFVNAPLDIDNRMRTSYNICGTETYRLNSGENAFGSGTNLQNVPSGGEEDEDDILKAGLVLPNVREIFVPDQEHTMFDTDMSKADMRIVAWEGNITEMKAMLNEGRDPYVESAREYYKDPTIVKARPDGSIHPKYDQFKRFGHGTHYLGQPAGLARRIGLTVHEVDRAQRWYFGKFPGLKDWHNRMIESVKRKRYVENIFGNRRYYFDRIDDATFREAIAWVPQSTVALTINRMWLNLWERYPHIAVLLQVHDSLVGQFPTWRRVECLAQLKEAASITLPYEDPLIIPIGVKTSEVSWGQCR
jgi:DNA polymerase-1